MGAAMCFVGVDGLRYTYKLQGQTSGHSLIATIVVAQCPRSLSQHSQGSHLKVYEESTRPSENFPLWKVDQEKVVYYPNVKEHALGPGAALPLGDHSLYPC